MISENFMVDGGRPRQILRDVRAIISGRAPRRIDVARLGRRARRRLSPAKLRALVDEIDPGVRLGSSELVADRRLQLARSAAFALHAKKRWRWCADNVDRAQNAHWAAPMLVENPSTYLSIRRCRDDRVGVSSTRLCRTHRMQPAARCEQCLRQRDQSRLRCASLISTAFPRIACGRSISPGTARVKRSADRYA
jgi:hypothetical protein